MSGASRGIEKQWVTRDVEPVSIHDLLERPRRATVAFTQGDRVDLLPARSRLSDGSHWFGVPAGLDPQLDGREVVLLIDDGQYWFELRGVSVRGLAKSAQAPQSDPAERLVWYAITPQRTLAWDYGSLRKA